LSASLRWCLTGTPIQNTLYDLGSLISFLRISQLESKAEFRKHIAHPISEKQAGSIARLRLLLKSICLRRTTDCLHLPKLKEVVHKVQLSSEESMLYRGIQGRVKSEISHLVSTTGNPNTEGMLLRMVTQLRRACNHGTMDSKLLQYVGSDDSPQDEDVKMDLVGLGGGRYCAQCSCDVKIISNDPGMETGRLTPCDDLLCSDCYVEWERAVIKNRASRARPRCPICQKTVPKSGAHGKRGPRQDGLNFQGQSSKIAHLVEDIRQNNKKWYVNNLHTGGISISSAAIFVLLKLTMILQHCVFIMDENPRYCQSHFQPREYSPRAGRRNIKYSRENTHPPQVPGRDKRFGIAHDNRGRGGRVSGPFFS